MRESAKLVAKEAVVMLIPGSNIKLNFNSLSGG